MTFAKDILKLASGSTLAQTINVLSMPILTRLFLPAEFGVAALFIAIIALFGPIMCLRYELGIMLPKYDNEAANVFWLSLIILILLTCISSIIVIGDKIVFHSVLNKQIERYYYLIPIGLFFHGFMLVLNFWCSRKKSFSSLAVARVSKSVFSNTTKLLFGFQGFVNSGYLIIGDLSGRAIESIFLLQKVFGVDKNILTKNFSLKIALQMAKQFKKFPLFSSWGMLFNTFSRQLPIFILSFFFESKIVGFYAITINILMLPANMIAGAISRVFFQKASQLYSENIIPTELVSQVVNKILIAGIFPCLVLIFFGKDIFSVILGKAWDDTGIYIQILTPMAYFGFIGTSIGNLFHVYQKQEVAFFFNFARCITIATSLLIGGKAGNIIFTLLLLSLSDIFIRIFGLGWILIKSYVDIKNLLYNAVKYSFFALSLILLIYFVHTNISNSIFLLFGLLIIATAVYYIVFLDKHIIPFLNIRNNAS